MEVRRSHVNRLTLAHAVGDDVRMLFAIAGWDRWMENGGIHYRNDSDDGRMKENGAR
jgi:hypothetical protein